MIIQNTQGMTVAAFFQGKIAFEIHFPKLVRVLLLKALIRSVFASFFCINLAISTQDLRDGTRARQFGMPFPLYVRLDFTTAPKPDAPAIIPITLIVNLFRAIFFSAEIRKGIFRIRAIYDKIFNNTDHQLTTTQPKGEISLNYYNLQ
jgi:hypothetical protein